MDSVHGDGGGRASWGVKARYRQLAAAQDRPAGPFPSATFNRPEARATSQILGVWWTERDFAIEIRRFGATLPEILIRVNFQMDDPGVCDSQVYMKPVARRMAPV
jgi:hypothetical protein